MFIPVWRLWVHSVTIMNNLSKRNITTKGTTDMYHADSYFYCLSMMLICCWSANLGRCLKWQPPMYCVNGDPNDTDPQHCDGFVVDSNNASWSQGTHWIVVDGLTTFVEFDTLKYQDFPTDETERKDGNPYWVCSDSNSFYLALRAIITLTYVILGFVGQRRHKKVHFWNALVNLVVCTGYTAMMILGSSPTKKRSDAIKVLFYVTTIFDVSSGLIPFAFAATKRFFVAVTQEEAEILGERFGLLLVICLGEIIMGAASALTDMDLDHRNEKLDADWEFRVNSPISAWDAWAWNIYDNQQSPLFNPRGWRKNPYIGRISSVGMVYMLKVLIFDAPIAEEQVGALHPLARGGTKGEGAHVAELYKLTTFPIALSLIMLGAVTEDFTHHNSLITGIDGEKCALYNASLGSILVFTGLQLMCYKEKNDGLKWLKMRKVTLRAMVGFFLFCFHDLYEFIDGGPTDGSGWQLMIILLLVLCVVINDVRCRNLAFKFVKAEMEAETDTEREAVKVPGRLAGFTRWCRKIKADWEAEREVGRGTEFDGEAGEVAEMETGTEADTVEMDAAAATL